MATDVHMWGLASRTFHSKNDKITRHPPCLFKKRVSDVGYVGELWTEIDDTERRCPSLSSSSSTGRAPTKKGGELDSTGDV